MDINVIDNMLDAGTRLGFTRGLITAAHLFSVFSDEYQKISALVHSDRDRLDEIALLGFTERNAAAREIIAKAKEAA